MVITGIKYVPLNGFEYANHRSTVSKTPIGRVNMNSLTLNIKQ